MAVRIQKSGRILCAAMHDEQPGDTYVDDGLHYELSVVRKILVTTANHSYHGQWWWIGDAKRQKLEIEPFYLEGEWEISSTSS